MKLRRFQARACFLLVAAMALRAFGHAQAQPQPRARPRACARPTGTTLNSCTVRRVAMRSRCSAGGMVNALYNASAVSSTW